jgi:hypothetical protein
VAACFRPDAASSTSSVAAAAASLGSGSGCSGNVRATAPGRRSIMASGHGGFLAAEARSCKVGCAAWPSWTGFNDKGTVNSA